MKQSSRYVFGAALASVALGGVPGLVHQAHAVLITNADFTFDTQTLTGTTTAGSSFGGFLADSGTGTAYGVHALAAAAYSEPAGNGSPKSFSSNDWSVGDYYQFSVPTSGISAIQIAFDQIGSGTGPADFSLFASTDGLSFSSVSSYVIALNTGATSAGNSSAWLTSSSQSFYNHAFDLSGITGLNDDGSAVFRLVDLSTVAVTATTGVGTAGTDRVDNFIVSGTAVPEPASLSLLTVAAAGILMRRRSQS